MNRRGFRRSVTTLGAATSIAGASSIIAIASMPAPTIEARVAVFLSATAVHGLELTKEI